VDAALINSHQGKRLPNHSRLCIRLDFKKSFNSLTGWPLIPLRISANVFLDVFMTSNRVEVVGTEMARLCTRHETVIGAPCDINYIWDVISNAHQQNSEGEFSLIFSLIFVWSISTSPHHCALERRFQFRDHSFDGRIEIMRFIKGCTN